MFRRVLIANRGEIAMRVIRACREMGIESVAVYSDADARAPHVVHADHAVKIGPAQAAESYLSIDAVLKAAADTRVEAIHPGYGFLAENPAFARACVDRGIAFVGPPADAIQRMGSKIAARTLAREAGVPVVPGETPADQSDAAIEAAAGRVGFPLLVKPAAGGGGIGMKRVLDQASLRAAVAQARREATGAFGDGTLYLERLLDRPRHIEIQVFADAAGSVVHLFERECSIQRRHQKVIEESPSCALTPALRARMGAAAVAAARAAGYRNAGTVEFLVDGWGDDASFYFLEMNTRLQVEHPVTEQVTGVDLVRAQIAVAAGEPLPWSQADLSQRGHAIEARIYAEDPERDDLPQAGALLLYREPSLPGIRIDSGVVEGGEVSVHYDPLIAKLIATADTRDHARRRLIAALRQFPILGVRTNVPLLIALLEHPRVVSGDIDTALLDRERHVMLDVAADEPPPEVRLVAQAAADTSARPGGAQPQTLHDPWTTLNGWRG